MSMSHLDLQARTGISQQNLWNLGQKFKNKRKAWGIIMLFDDNVD